MEIQTRPEEAVGPHFNRDAMLDVRERTLQAIRGIAGRIHAGMVEEDAVELARDMLADAGMLRGWHEVYVRFGPNTLKTFGAPSEPGVVLGEDDIFFIDIGPVWRQWEGDGGDSFVTGADPEKARCAADARAIFHEVRRHWLRNGSSGQDLYRFAAACAQARGWELNLDLSGHRLADFPHSALHQGALADYAHAPSELLWVLEIHIRHPSQPYGAFFEDMLLDDGFFPQKAPI
ncbi:M24 family metallopeptidase [Chromobacterium sp. IIBBL 290-4]|uniref:M24 family metallopeptidase n=1 Tax=Chromobacterium sp. IIBBL 290-4 TaxID=2953890 RepID=UPI0020B748F3|nr:M24 family metallopeptidase [Chromobacterium sp. IIBBL 290-4]UTH75909.1 M24 family metallopeptidase [Chromobacterium sp. IIBBL 290-4]